MAKKNQVFIDIVIDDKGTTKRVAVDAKKLGVELDRSAAASEKGAKNTDKLSKSTKDLDRNMRGTAKMTSNSTKEFSKQQQGMGGLVGAYATLAAQVFAVSAAFQFLQGAANTRNLIAGQEAMGAVTGRTYKSMTQSIVAATDAQLKYADAAKAAAIGSAAGLTGGQLTKLGEAAKNASFALGRDLTDSFNRLIRGVTKAEPELLDELGIILRLEPATEKYAQSIGKARTELNAYERTQAVTNEVLDQARTKFAAIESLMDKDAAALAQFTKSFDELANTIKIGLINGLTPGLKFLSENTLALVASLTLIATPIIRAILPSMDNFIERTNKLAAAQKEVSEAREQQVRKEAKALKLSTRNNREYLDSLQKIARQNAEMRGVREGAGMSFLTSGNLGEGNAAAAGRILKNARQQMDSEQNEIRTGSLKQYSDAELRQLEDTYAQKLRTTEANEKEMVQQRKNTLTRMQRLDRAGTVAWEKTTKGVVTSARVMARGVNIAFSAIAIFGLLGLAIEAVRGLINILDPLSELQKRESKEAADLTEKYTLLNEELERNKRARDSILSGGASVINQGQSLQGIDIPTVIQNLDALNARTDQGSKEYEKAKKAIMGTLLQAVLIDKQFVAIFTEFKKGGTIAQEVGQEMTRLANDTINAGQTLASLPNLMKATNTAMSALGRDSASNTPLSNAVDKGKTELKALQASEEKIQKQLEKDRISTESRAVARSLGHQKRLQDQARKNQEDRAKEIKSDYAKGGGEALGEGAGIILNDPEFMGFSQEILAIEEEILLLKKDENFIDEKTFNIKAKANAAERSALKILQERSDALKISNDRLAEEESRRIERDITRIKTQVNFTKKRTHEFSLEGKISNIAEKRFKIEAKRLKAQDAVNDATQRVIDAGTSVEESAKEALRLAEAKALETEKEADFLSEALDLEERRLKLTFEQLNAKRQSVLLDREASALARTAARNQGKSGGSLASQDQIRRDEVNRQEKLIERLKTIRDQREKEETEATRTRNKEILNTEGFRYFTSKEGRANSLAQETASPSGIAAEAARQDLANARSSLTIYKDVASAVRDTNKAKIEGLQHDVRGAMLLGEAKVLHELLRDARLAGMSDEKINAQMLGFEQEAAKIHELTTLESQRAELASSIQGGMETAFMAIVDGSKSAKQAFGDMARSILASIAQMIVKMLVLKMLQTAMPSLFGKEGIQNTDIDASMPERIFKKGGYTPSYAGGGYGLKKNNFSRGGMARGAQSGYAATLHGNEAVVPLPDNRSIPVTLNGAGGQNNNVTVNVAMDSSGNVSQNSQQDGAQAGKLGSMIAAAVQQELQFQKRSGGILNPYGVS